MLVGSTAVFTVITSILLYDKKDRDDLMLRAALDSEAFSSSAQGGWQQPDLPGSVPAPDWSIRRECEGQLDAFFVVSSEASDWYSRAEIRSTILEDQVARTLRWAGAFLLQEAREPLVAKWIEVEGQATGDLIVLPSARKRSAGDFEAFHTAVRWALDHCAKARYVIKMTADMVVHPMRLYKCLRRMEPNGMGTLLCDMRGSSHLRPNTDAVVHAAKDKFWSGTYQLYCTGSVVVASLELLRSLDHGLWTVGRETAFVPGRSQHQERNMSLEIRNVGVGWLKDISLDLGWNSTFVKLRDASMRRLDRYSAWYFAIWRDLVWNKPRFKKLLTSAGHPNSVLWKGLEN